MAASFSRWLIPPWRSHAIPHGEHAVAQHCAITFVRPGRRGETLSAEAVERSRAGRSGIYDVRVCDAAGDTVAEFRGHSRTTGGRFFAEG